MDYLIISAATEGSRYVDCIDRQRELYGDDYLGLIVPDRGSWAENTKIKPDAIREALKVRDCVLWLDADCVIDAPEMRPTGNWDMATTYNFHPDHRIKVSAGFLMFRRTSKVRRFLGLWDRINNHVDKDHPALTRALNRSRNMEIFDMTAWLKGRHQINGLAPERGVVSA